MVTLDRLVNVLGSYGTRPLSAVPRRKRALHSVVLHDPAADSVTTGDVVLAVGVRSWRAAVELAVAARGSAVLVRCGSEDRESTGDDMAADEGLATAGSVRSSSDSAEGRALAEAEALGITVLGVDAAVSWSQVCAVVYGLVFEGGEGEIGRGPSDLFALADTVAAAVAGQVTVEDALSRVVAYSSRQQDADPARLDTILGRRVPDPVRVLFAERGVFDHLAVSDEPLFVAPAPGHGLRGRMVAAARAGRELLGSVWVTCDEPLTGARLRALADGAAAVAAHLLRSRVGADLERRVESEAVVRLLDGAPDAAAVCGTLGLAPGPFRVLAVQAHAADERHAAVLLAHERATTGFGWSRPGRSALFGNTLYTVLRCGADPGPARRWLRELEHDLPAHVTLAAGIGGVCEPAELPAGRREADECLALHTTRPGRPPVDYDESWDEILLHRLRTAARAGRTPTRGPIADLARHDERHRTPYVPTLRAWLEAQGDPRAAARALAVHPNTVRYRMHRMRELTRLDLDDAGHRLALLIALAVR